MTDKLYVRGIAVNARELIETMKHVLIDHEHQNLKNEEVKKNFHPNIFTAAEWSKDDLDEMLAKIEQAQSSTLVKENDKLKKVVKYLVEKNSNKKEHMLGKFRILWEELRNRNREEDGSTLGVLLR